MNLDNGKIILRAPELYDVDVLYLWENDRHTWKVSNTITPFSKYILKKYIENSHLDIYQTRQLRLMIDLQKGSEVKPIGSVDLFEFDPYHNRAGVGILIGDYSERKKGYASFALDELISYSFETLQLHQLYCNIADGNTESLELFKNKGFILTGTKKEWIKTPKGYIDEFSLQLINQAFPKRIKK